MEEAKREAGQSAIRDLLELMAQVEDFSRPYASFVLRHGRAWTSAPRPATVPLMTPKRCFGNAQIMLFDDVTSGRFTLTYVEGYACSGSLSASVPLPHAWLVDNEGRVVDPTFEETETSAYFGVPFARDFLVGRALRTGTTGPLIDDPEHRWEVVSDPAVAREAVALGW